MSEKKLGTDGLEKVWGKVFELIKSITGDVDVKGKGTLQQQINNHTHKYAGSSSVGGAANSANSLNVIEIEENTNLNDIKTPGFYKCSLDSKAKTIVNRPFDFAFFMIVGQHAGVYQEIIQYQSNHPKRYMRNLYTTWGEWYKIYSSYDKPTLTDLGLSAATTNVAGLMSASDKSKLDGIASGANAYTHPTSSGNKHIPSGGSSGQILRWNADGTAVWGNENNTTYSNFVKSGSGAKSGLVPAPPTTAGTTKYLREDGTWVVPPDTKTTVDASINSTSTNPVQNKVIYNAMIYKNNSYVQSLETGQAIEGYGSNPSEVLSGHDGTIRTIIEYLNRKAEASTATASFDGLMSAADKSKLDSITSNTCQTGTCSTAASTSGKTVSITGFTLAVGARVFVNFTNGNTSSSATLNVTSTGAKAMYYFDGTRVYYLNAGVYYEFIYDGTYWRLLGIANPNMLTGSRSYERYGVKLDSTSLQPLNSSYRPSLGTSSNKFNDLHVNNVYSGNGNFDGNVIINGNLSQLVNGNYVNICPPLPLVKGKLYLYSSGYIKLNIPHSYVKSVQSYYNYTGGTDCAGSDNPYNEVYVTLKVFGMEYSYDYSYGESYKPITFEVTLSNSGISYCCGSSTNNVSVQTPYNNSINFSLDALQFDSCGSLINTPTVTVTANSSSIYIFEISALK